MSERDEILASEMIAQRLRDPAYQDRLAVTRKRNTGYSDQTAEDLLTMNDVQLRDKYGDDVYLQAHRIGAGAERLRKSDSAERTNTEVTKDTGFSAAGAALRTSGNISGLLAGQLVEWWTDGEIPSEQATADILHRHNQTMDAVLAKTLTEELQEKQYYFGVEGELDAMDNEFEYREDLEQGKNPQMAALRREGKNALDAGERAWENPSVTGAIIAEGIGDMAISAPLGGAAGLVAKGASKALVNRVINNRVSRAASKVATAGAYSSGEVLQESVGVYAESVQDVMELDLDLLEQTSPIYNQLREEGFTPEAARSQLAGITAETAAIRQIPASMALGFITSKFEAMPIGVFRDSGVTRGMLQIAGEGIEEAGQGISGTINRNLAVEEYAQIGRGALEGVGEEAALGAIAGIGVAGVAASPAAAIGAAKTAGNVTAQGAIGAANALFAETQYNDPLRQDIMGGSRAGNVARTVSEATRPAREAAVQMGTAATNRVGSAVVDYTNKPSNKEIEESVQSTVDATESLTAVAEKDQLREEIQTAYDTADTGVPSEGLNDVAGGTRNVFDNMTGIMAKMGSKGFKATDADTAYAASQFQKVQSMVSSLPKEAQQSFGKVLSSKMVQNIQKQASKLDLNQEGKTADVETVRNVAKVNPTGVNPDATDQILEQSGEEISPEDTKLMKAASKLARIVNRHVDSQVQISRDKNINLTASGRKPGKEKTLADVSRQIFADGFVTEGGKKLRSINDFAREIFTGMQSPDGTVINQEGRVQSVSDVMTDMQNFAQHMVNKVSALNESVDDGYITEGGKRGGKLKNFDSPVRGVRQEGVRYSPDNPNSVAFAQQVAEEQNAVVDAFNTLREEFPEVLGSFPEMEKVELTPATQTTQTNETQDPTAIEESFDATAAEATSETNTTETPDTQPTAVEEESNSEERADEDLDEEAPATEDEPQTESDEEIDSDEQSLAEDEMSDEEMRELMDSPAQWNEADRARIAERANRLAATARAYVSEMMGDVLKKRVRQLRIYPNSLGFGPGYAHVSDDGSKKKIYLSESNFTDNDELTPEGKAILLHETAHVIDFTNDPKWISSSNFFRPNGKIRKEWDKITGGWWVTERMEYANSFKDEDPIQHQAEIFAVLTEFYFSKDDSILENSPEIRKEMEIIYGEKTQAVGSTTDETSTEGEPTSEGTGSDTIEESTPSNGVMPEFTEAFEPRQGDAPVTSLANFIEKFGTGFKMNREYLTILEELMPEFMARMNTRLQKKVKDGKVTKTVAQHVLDGRIDFRRFKAAALMDSETQEYNPKMLELSMLAVMDFIASATGSDPRKLDDTLEKMGLNRLDVTEEGLEKILFGLPPSQVADTLVSDLTRLWHMKEKPSQSVDDLEGISHGFAKEILTVLAEMDIIDIDTVKLNDDVNRQDAVTILVNTDKIADFQKRIGEAKGEGVSNSSRETIFNDAKETYSIGEKITSVTNSKGRGTGILSVLERRAVRSIQNIPHRLQKGRASLLEAMGEDNLAAFLGWKDPDIVTHPVLKRSVMGKNTSIRRDLLEVTNLVQGMEQQQSEEVFFPVGITKVGRHQMQGPNPQNNKLMRMVVAPQKSVLSTTDAQDTSNFWLGVTQQANLFKAEKKNHGEALRKAVEEFETKYGNAVDMVKTLMEGGAFDSDAFLAEVGQGEPALLTAIEAVAVREIAMENGDPTFETALSFELDGLTNGAANMMVNFGHGLLTPEDWTNFQRVGYFLGKTKQTVTDFFDKGAKDLYEKVSLTGDRMMMSDIKSLKPWQKEQRMAAGRLTSAFGTMEMNTETGEFWMTRNTAKNPMTKVNYGSGVQGVAVGLADDMLLEFYEKIQDLPDDVNFDTYFYPGVLKDMETLGLKLPQEFDKNFVFSKDSVEQFRKSIQFTVGKVLTNATRETLGHRIEQLNDMLVLSTNVQTKYLQKLFEKEVNELAEKLAREKVIGRNKKGQPNKGEIPREHYRALEEKMASMGAIFVSDEQTLAVDGFEKKMTDLRLSSNFDEALTTAARMRRPDDIGVRSLPFAVIGTGDAMMMNLIFGDDLAPNDVLPVFDGIDIPVAKIQQYAPSMNQAVLKSWERDVLGMVVQNYDGFLSNVSDPNLLNKTWTELLDDNKKESLKYFQAPEDLQRELGSRLKENRARKKVFKQLAVSVDQMGGSNVGFSRDGEELGFTEVNQRIQAEIDGTTKPKDVRNPVEQTTATAVMNNMRGLTNEQKKTLEILKPLMGDVKIVFGTLDQLNQFRQENYPDDGAVLKAPSQYDFKNDIMFMSTDSTDNVLHEMVHAATYQKVLEHYQGKRNDAVERLETLMQEFMDIESDGKNMNEAQAAIARRLARNDAINQAAAVNEFMAYVLTNSRVRAKAKQTNVIASFGSKVMQLLRKIMGGVSESMFDHVVFNTRVLNEPNIDDDNGDSTPPPDDPGDETTPPHENHNDYWIQNLKDYMRNLQDIDARKQKTGRDLYNADKVINDLRQGGLLANSKDRSTFKAIYGVVLSDMKLDPTAQIALNRVFEHVIENMTPEMFGSTPEDRQTYSAVLNSFGAYENEGASDATAVMFALSQTSIKFRNVLEQVPASEGAASVQGSLLEFLARATSFSMQKVMGMMETNDAPQDVLAAIAKVIIDHDQEKEFRILSRITQSLGAADDYVSGVFSSTAELMGQKEEELRENARGTTKQHLISAVTLGTNLLDKERTNLTAQGAKRVFHMGLPFLSVVPVREVVNEVVGTDKQNSKVVALLNRVNYAVSGMRQAYREDLPGILERQFINAPTKSQWQSMFKTLAKTDFSLLVDLDRMQSSMKMMEERATRQAEIQNLEQTLQQRLNPSDFNDVIDKMKQLADFMNGEKVGKLLVRNAYAIAKNMDGDFDPDLVPIIDRLTSVYAIDRMDAEIREETVRLWQDDPKGVTSIMAYIQGLNEAEEAKPGLSEQAKLNGYKGYIPNEGRKNTQMVVDLDSNEDLRQRMGYIKLDIPYEGETDSVYPRSYYISNVRRQGGYSQGVMQNVAMTYRGVDTNTGLTVDNSVAGFISGDSSIDRIIQNQMNPNTVLENEKEALMPVFAGDGTVMGFERAISTDVQNLHFGRDENLGVMLGAWAGRQVEEALADQYNKELIDNLHNVWVNRESGTDDEFEDMKTSTDKIYQETWKLVPQSTKNYIESKFEGSFMVPRSMVNLSLGYREPSVTDMWSGKSRLPEGVQKTVVAVTERFMGRNAMRWLSTGEEVFQGTVSTAKDIIVIRSLVVPVANLQANVAQLANAGVPIKQITKQYRSKLAEAEEFVHNRSKIIDLEQKLKIARNANQKQILMDRIQTLYDLEKRMTIAPLLETGQFKTLSEGITDVDVEISSGRLGDYMEKLSDRLPDRLADIAKVGLVSKSTKLYQVLNRATQYGDFIAKSIYYDHLISQGLSDEVAQAMINEEFVNYSVLPGRVRSGLESNGLTWFMNFKIRILKIAAKQMRDNPVRSLALNSTVDVGGPLSDNLLTVMAEGRLDYSTGFEMLFDAPELNPWVALMSQ